MPSTFLPSFHPVALRTLLVMSLLWWATSDASAQHSTFNILKGDNIVGSIQVARIATADRATYLITSYAEIDMLLKQVVRTSTVAEYLGGAMIACNTMMRVNKGLRDSSNMSTRGGVSRCYVHPDAPFQRTSTPQWTTARMYFEEPTDQTSIFVESVLQDCPLRKTGPNTYTLTFPNRNQNRYVYFNGVLQEVLVDRLLFNLVFRRA